MSTTTTASDGRNLTTFTTLLQSQGAATALAWLNAGVPHRYSAIYRFHQDAFVNVVAHDKQGESMPALLRVVPFPSSFCQFVLREGVFSTEDSVSDVRLDGHPYQGVVVSYHGVTIANDAGESLGTLCHFDMGRQSPLDDEQALLQDAAKMLRRYLQPTRQRPVRLNSLQRLLPESPSAHAAPRATS